MGKNKNCLWMWGYFIHLDYFDFTDFTGNYTPNTTNELVPVLSFGYQIKMKKYNLSFGNIQKWHLFTK